MPQGELVSGVMKELLDNFFMALILPKGFIRLSKGTNVVGKALLCVCNS